MPPDGGEGSKGDTMRDSIEVSQRATLLRLPEEDLATLRRLVLQTRVSQSDYLREAIDDLLEKYGHVFEATGARP